MKFVQNENFKPKIKPMKTYKMNFINKKNKQTVLNFALTLYGSWRVKTFFRVLEREYANLNHI